MKGLALLLAALPLAGQQAVHYEVRFPNLLHHEAEIRAAFSGVTQPKLEVVMSSSSPGRYALADFAKNLYNFRASDGNGGSLKAERESPSEWGITGHHGTVIVEYTLFGDRADGTYDAIDGTHAHLNMPATLVWAHGFENAPSTLKFDLPPHSKWSVATQLIPAEGGTWSAPNLQRLMDGPVEISSFTMPEWTLGDAKFRLALHHGGTAAEATAFARMCEAVTIEAEGVFGAFPKYDGGTYTFLVDLVPYATGDGMEHRNSTVITGTLTLKDAADKVLGTVSHEFFHSWNVRRIRPRSLEPFNFEQANMSGELWFAEGFTNYYGPLVLRRAGLESLDQFTNLMSGAVTAVLTAPGRQITNVIGMSREAPFVDGAAPLEPVNTANTFISYYTYGQALALGIDLEIRTRFPGKSLDDWMRTMWREHPDVQKPYTLDDLQNALTESTGSSDFASEIFRKYIYGQEPIDYATLLGHAGLLLRKPPTSKVWLGAPRIGFSEKGVELTGVTLRGAPLYEAGLDRGDQVLLWDGKAITNEHDLNEWLGLRRPGDRVKLSVQSRSGVREVVLVLAERPGFEIVPYERAGKQVTQEMAEFRENWLGSKHRRPLPRLEKYCPRCNRALPFDTEHCPYDGADLRITREVETRSE
jgi:predicted metalloprotease with PDZ domain